MSITNWLKWKIAGKEMDELARLKLRINELQVWCGYDFPAIDAAGKWLKDIHDYPCQFKGQHGSICDFREYLRKEHKCN